MAQDTIKFVDSIASSPTTRLDVNDGTIWRTRKLSCPPPRLRRAMSSNAMSDGVFVSSSAYDSRVVTLELALVHTSEDNAATEWQKLARELDRTDNFLMYQPTGATKPVFFRTFRSDIPSLEQFTGGASAFKQPTVEVLAEPFALGLLETLGPFTVNNDPAAGSNGCFFDVTGVIGDVATPTVFQFSNASSLERYGYLAVRQHGTPPSLVYQAESGSLGTDTTNPGGGPDAAMSGTGTNNFVRTSFATVATMTSRVTISVPSSVETIGRYRVLAAVRRSDNTSVMTMKHTLNSADGPIVTLPLTTSRTLVDLGVGSNYDRAAMSVGYGPPNATAINSLSISAARASGTGTLDIDYVALVPADEALAIWDLSSDGSAIVFDGFGDKILLYNATFDPILGLSQTTPSRGYVFNGSFPMLQPNQTNRLYMLTSNATAVHVKADVNVVSLKYWPRYLYVRPSAT